MKILILIPRQYSLAKSVEKAFSSNGADCFFLNYRDFLKQTDLRFNTQMFRFPDVVRKKWEAYFFGKINKWYIDRFTELEPDVVFIYNNEMILPDTLVWLRDRKIRIAFYLGDNPLYTPTNRYNLTILKYADIIFVPDTFWQIQLQKIGLKNVQHLLPPLPAEEYYRINHKNEGIQYSTDVFYLGMSYKDPWGYKKAMFLNYFTNYNLKLIGNNAWSKWFQFFPDLEKHFELKKSFLSVELLNEHYNSAKIVPVDGNPGIINGIHMRILEVLASGTLPLMEYTVDMDFIFEGVSGLPVIKDYREIPEIVECYLLDDQKRKSMVHQLKRAYNSKYNTETINRLLVENLY